MTSLIKRDFYVSRWMLVILLLNISFSYYVSVSPLFITFWIFIMFYVSLFYTDEHNQANQTFVSFPIKREKIVFARYIFIAVILLVTLLAIFIFDHRSEEHTSELQSRGHLVCRILLAKKNRLRPTTSRK